MKKRLLITSIVMMLVVAVALSTATYAWFTSNANVTANTVTLTASTNNAPSIGIAWTNTNFGTAITAISPTHVENDANTLAETTYFAPMVPNSLSVGTTAISAATAAGGVDFYSATIKDSPEKFNSDVKHWGAEAAANQVAPYIWNNGTVNSFFLKNLSDTYDMSNVKLTATVTGEGADLIRIAVFARIQSNAATELTGNYNLVKVLSNAYDYTEATTYASNTVYYTEAKDGSVISVGTGEGAHAIANQEELTAYNAVEGQQAFTRANTRTAVATSGITGEHLVTTDITYNTTDNASFVDLGGLNKSCVAELIVYVWTDGAALVDNRGGQAATIQLDISAVR